MFKCSRACVRMAGGLQANQEKRAMRLRLNDVVCADDCRLHLILKTASVQMPREPLFSKQGAVSWQVFWLGPLSNRAFPVFAMQSAIGENCCDGDQWLDANRCGRALQQRVLLGILTRFPFNSVKAVMPPRKPDTVTLVQSYNIFL